MMTMFQYVKIESHKKRFVCLEQSVATFAWILFFKRNVLRPIFRGVSPRFSFGVARNWLLSNAKLMRKNIFYLIIFVAYKYKRQKVASSIKLPFYGQICVPVHRGYKIFNLRRSLVIKVFDPDVAMSAIRSEVERLKLISTLDFAPSLKRWSIEGRWFEESYFSGSLDSSGTPMDSEAVLEKFSKQLIPYINILVLFQPPISKNVSQYIEETVQVLELSGLARNGATIKEYKKIKTFLESMMDRLRSEGPCSVFLVLTHGDFCPANMLNTETGLKVIDWEGAGFRSALFDVYSYFFYRSVSRKVPARILVSEINEAMPLFNSSLDKKGIKTFENVTKLEKVYRWVYYIEQVCKEVEREGTDKNLNIMDNILKYIEVFNEYEEILTGKFELAPKFQM